MLFSDILRAAFDLSAFLKMSKKGQPRSSLPSSFFFLQIFRIATTITKMQFSEISIPLIMLKSIKRCRGRYENGLFSNFWKRAQVSHNA